MAVKKLTEKRIWQTLLSGPQKGCKAVKHDPHLMHWTASVRPAFGRSGQHKNHSQGSLTFLQKVIRIETLKKSQELRPWKKSQPQRTSLHHADFPSGSSLCIGLVVVLANSDCTESFHFWTHSCPLQLSFHNWEEHSTFVYTQKFHFYAESVYSSICVQMYQRCAPWSVASPSHWLFRPQQLEFSGFLQKSDKGQFLYSQVRPAQGLVYCLFGRHHAKKKLRNL